MGEEKSVSPNTEITLTVRLNGDLTRLAGRARFAVTLPHDATIKALFAKVGDENPTLVDKLTQAIPVVNGSHVSKEQILTDGQEVALLMPVAGGT